jgi:hypothetical protein
MSTESRPVSFFGVRSEHTVAALVGMTLGGDGRSPLSSGSCVTAVHAGRSRHDHDRSGGPVNVKWDRFDRAG